MVTGVVVTDDRDTAVHLRPSTSSRSNGDALAKPSIPRPCSNAASFEGVRVPMIACTSLGEHLLQPPEDRRNRRRCEAPEGGGERAQLTAQAMRDLYLRCMRL
jgi:hypothetical protein